MTENKSKFYNFIVVGAGPTGLAAGIAAARAGYTVVVIEKGETAGPRPRGEGISRYPLLDDLMGRDFFDSKCFRMDGSTVFHSPGDQKQTRIAGPQDIYFFEWRQFIGRLVEAAQKEGVCILYNSEVQSPIEDEQNSTCIGVMYKDNTGNTKEVYGNAILACDGHQSVLGKHYGVDYDLLNCAMVKCIVDNANIDIKKTSELQFYVIGNGDLAYAPNLPPCVAYGFPIGGNKMELGLMLRMIQADKMKKTVKNPNMETFLEVWNKLKQSYPGFCTYFQGAKIEYEYVTALSNAKLVKDIVPTKGVVLAGDSAGFIDPFGSSGLYSGTAMSTFWIELLSKEIKKIQGNSEVTNHIEELWTQANIARYKKEFKKTKISKTVKGSYLLIGVFEWYVFRHLRTSERINKRWKLISWMLNKA